METIFLNIKTFDFFKFICTLLFFVSFFFLPILPIISFAVLALGKAHSLGAWIGMWRAKKINWKLFFWILFVIMGVSYWGTQIASFKTLAFVSSFFFLLHYLFDEVSFHVKNSSIYNYLFSAVSPCLLISIFLFRDFFSISIQKEVYFVIFLILLGVEMLFIEFDWFFSETKVLSLFLIFSVLLNKDSYFVFMVLLFTHYFFWFIFPIYKLHKYKREERDSFAIILLLISATSVFLYSSRVWGTSLVLPPDLFVFKSFYMASLVHILTTAPFAYIFGLQKPNYSNQNV